MRKIKKGTYKPCEINTFFADKGGKKKIYPNRFTDRTTIKDLGVAVG